MSRRVAPRARRMPTSPGPLGHAGQHDVHDADAAHQQADGGDRPRHHVEDALGALLLAQDLPGHDHVQGRVTAACGEDRPHHLGRRHHLLGVRRPAPRSRRCRRAAGRSRGRGRAAARRRAGSRRGSGWARPSPPERPRASSTPTTWNQSPPTRTDWPTAVARTGTGRGPPRPPAPPPACASLTSRDVRKRPAARLKPGRLAVGGGGSRPRSLAPREPASAVQGRLRARAPRPAGPAPRAPPRRRRGALRPGAGACGGTEGRARTVTLSMPRAPICATASRRAPSPTEDMAITAPTPKTTPRMERVERSLCSSRLRRPRRSSSPRGTIRGSATAAVLAGATVRPARGAPAPRCASPGRRCGPRACSSARRRGDLLAGHGVQVAGRLVGQQQPRLGDQGPGHEPSRCASPPDSSEGRWSARCARPTRSRQRQGPRPPLPRRPRIRRAAASPRSRAPRAGGSGGRTGTRSRWCGCECGRGPASSRLATGVPSSRYSPSVGRSRQPRMASSVDLPEPEGPITASDSPSATSR